MSLFCLYKFFLANFKYSISKKTVDVFLKIIYIYNQLFQ
jgi:hypothetical protein